MLLCSEVAVVFCLALSQPATPRNPEEVQDNQAEAISLAAQELERVHELCDWPAVIVRAEGLRRLAPRGSDAWFEACCLEVVARYNLWQPGDIERVARDALEALADVRRDASGPPRSALGRLHPRIAGYVLQLERILAHVLQSNGWHAEALGHLNLVMLDLGVGPAVGAADLRWESQLDLARSLIALGREGDAMAALTSLRDGFRGSRPAASASVLLQARDGLSAYRGKYQGDAEHAARMRVLLEKVVPRARERAADRLGFAVEDVARIPVGFVDLPSDLRQMGAMVEGDARRPAITPVVLVFNEVLALDMLDMETVLVHELTHAVLMQACGPAYHALPLWMVEGLSEAVAEQTDDNLDFWLANRLLVDPSGFASRYFWQMNKLVFDGGPCSTMASPEAGFAILPLVEREGIVGIRRLVDHFREGRSLEEALHAVAGMGVAEYLKLAEERVQAELQTRRELALITAFHMGEAIGRGPAAVLRCAEDAIQDQPTRIAIGLALWKRADALGELGRFEEALAAHRELQALRRVHPSYVELALMGQARALLALGRAEEARAVLHALQRDAMTPELVRWASEQLTR